MRMARSRRRSTPEVPLCSMSDIAMLLLIFFIVTTSFVIQRSLFSELPSVTPEKEKATPETLTVLVDEEFVYLNEERIKMNELAPFLAMRLADKVKLEDKAVVLDGKPTVRYERVAWAANEIKRAGGIVTMMKVED